MDEKKAFFIVNFVHWQNILRFRLFKLWIFMSFVCHIATQTEREKKTLCEFHSINLSSAQLYCQKENCFRMRLDRWVSVVEKGAKFSSIYIPFVESWQISSFQISSSLLFPPFFLAVVVPSCFIYHIIFAGEFSFPNITRIAVEGRANT